MANEPMRRTSAFTPGEYIEIVSALIAMGYQDVTLHKLKQDQPHLFLRHDIDICTQRALQIANEEANIGVSSTYYFLVSSDLYNLSSLANRAILRKIVELGHDVGLHFDATVYDAAGTGLEPFALQECKMLEDFSNQAVSSISFHRPAKEWLNKAGKFAGYRHTYEPAFFSDIGYVSDSNGGWHHGHPFDHSAVDKRTAIQLLTHPIWWCNTASQDVAKTLSIFKAEQANKIEADLQATVTAYRTKQ